MNANGDDADNFQRVRAERDAYVANQDINIHVGNTSQPLPPSPPPPAVERKLAERALRQAQEKRSNLLATDGPEVNSANIKFAQVPKRLREPSGRDIGGLHSVLEYYQKLSPPRLVIVGAPGTGKTVLLLELQIRLLQERETHPRKPIPVLVSAAAFDTTDTWKSWLAGQVSTEFGIPRRAARILVSSRRILPLIDGLDEMGPPGDDSPNRARTLVQSLNTAFDGGLGLAPAVVTCRPGEYQRVASGLKETEHIALDPLDANEAAEYLDRQTRDDPEGYRWHRVLEALRNYPDGPVAAELATPWRLTMALAAYRGGVDPVRLFLESGFTGNGYSEHVSGTLLDSYIHVAVDPDPLKRPTYPEFKVRRWLASLAADLDQQSRTRGGSATDLALHEWCQPRSLASRLSYSAFRLLPFLAAAVWGLKPSADSSVTNAAEIAVFALSASGAFSPQPRAGSPGSGRDGPANRFQTALSAGLAAGLTFGLTSGLAFGLLTGLMVGLVSGLIVAPVALLASGHRNVLTVVTATWLAYGLACVLAYILDYGLASGIAGGGAGGLAYGLVAGVIAGLASRLTSFSPRARRPRTIIRSNGLLGLVGGLAIGLATGLTPDPVADLASAINTEIPGRFRGLPFAPGSGLTTGIAFGVAVWFAVCGRVWIRYHLSVAWNAFRGKNPLRFGAFLHWAVNARLLREAGISYQFRHRQLQEWAPRLAKADSTAHASPQQSGHFPSD